jgi:hypothetical protein
MHSRIIQLTFGEHRTEDDFTTEDTFYDDNYVLSFADYWGDTDVYVEDLDWIAAHFQVDIEYVALEEDGTLGELIDPEEFDEDLTPGADYVARFLVDYHISHKYRKETQDRLDEVKSAVIRVEEALAQGRDFFDIATLLFATHYPITGEGFRFYDWSKGWETMDHIMSQFEEYVGEYAYIGGIIDYHY